MTNGDDNDEARRILERVSRQSDPGQSMVSRGANRLRGHLNATDADQDDPIEVIGTRIGRAIAFVAMGACVIWLVIYLARGG